MEKNDSTSSREKADKTAQTLSDTITAILDRLAGKKSDLKLSFEDLTFDTGVFKARLNGSIVLDVVYAHEAKPTA